jgi:4a-hydroxytetrahydrobiopterin dehydratase
VSTLLDDGLLTETLRALPGWEGDRKAIWRDVTLAPAVDNELRRQIAVDGAAMKHSARVEDRGSGVTRFVLSTSEDGGVTELDIAMASHISGLMHTISDSLPGIDAVRQGEAVVTVRPADITIDVHGHVDHTLGDEPPTVGVGTVTGGSTPMIPDPDDRPGSPEPGVNAEQQP